MKDAKGHGSDAGIHSSMIQSLPKKMGRRHFEQIAETLRAQAPHGPAKNFVDPNDPRNPQSNAAWDAHNARVNAMADHLATTNPGFNRALFIKAAQPDTSYKNKSTRAVTRGNAAKQLTGFNMSTKRYPSHNGSVGSKPAKPGGFGR